jgi:hypothetical protein
MLKTTFQLLLESIRQKIYKQINNKNHLKIFIIQNMKTKKTIGIIKKEVAQVV